MAAKTVKQILAEEEKSRQEWEAQMTHKGFKVSFLRLVMEKVQNPEGWKLPWAASVPHQAVGAVLTAVEYFHADKARINGIEPIIGNVLMSGNGYQG